MSRGVKDTKGEQGRTSREMEGSRGRIIRRVCVLPSGSGAKLGVGRVGVVEWEVICWVVVGVGGTAVVEVVGGDTLSTDRHGMG